MIVSKKTFRYYYWLIKEFVKKHIKLILVSFLLSLIFIIIVVSLSSYLEIFLSNRKEVIGFSGKYDFNNLPDEILRKVSNGLIFVNEKGEIVPTLASYWEQLKNGKEYRFHLRDGLLWNDGKPFTAYDINYNFKDIESKIIDNKTIYFKLIKSLPIFPTYLSKPILRNGLVGVAGLYKVDKLIIKFGYINEISLAPNKQNLPIIVYKFYNHDNDLIAAYKKGEVNQITVTNKSIADVFSKWKNTKVVKSVDYHRLLTFFFNLDNPVLRQKDIRQAIIIAINRDNFKDNGEISIGPIPPISWAYNPKLANDTQDPNAALKILKKSASDSAVFKFATYYDYLDISSNIINSLESAGLNIDLNLITYDKPKNFDILLAFWKVPLDPDQYYFWHSTQKQGNIGNYNNVKVDKLLEDGRNSLTINDRKEIYFDFQKIILDDPPAMFLYYPYIYTIKRK